MPAAFDFVEDTAEKSFDFQADPIPTPEPAPTISPTAQLAKARLAFAPLAGQAVANLPDKPLITLPEWPKGEGSLEEQITGQVYGKLKDFLGFMTSPKGAAVTGAAIAAPEVAGPIISAAMLPAAVEEGIGTVKSIGKGDIPGAAGHLTGLTLTGAGVLGGVAQFLPRTVAEARVPMEVPRAPEPITIPEPVYSGPTPPKIAAVEQAARRAAVKTARPVVPETPPEPQRGMTILDEIRAAGADTKAKIQKLFPQLSRETAAKLRDQAFPREKQPDNISRAEVDRLFLDKLNEESNREIEASSAPANPAPLTPAEQAEARADLAAELGEAPQAPVAPEPAPAPEAPPAISAPDAKAPEPTTYEKPTTKPDVVSSVPSGVLRPALQFPNGETQVAVPKERTHAQIYQRLLDENHPNLISAHDPDVVSGWVDSSGKFFTNEEVQAQTGYKPDTFRAGAIEVPPKPTLPAKVEAPAAKPAAETGKDIAVEKTQASVDTSKPHERIPAELQSPEDFTAQEIQKLATAPLPKNLDEHSQTSIAFDLSSWTNAAKREAQGIPDVFAYVPTGTDKFIVEFPDGTRPSVAISSLVEAIKQGDGPGPSWLPTAQEDAIKSALKRGDPVLAAALEQHGFRPPRGYAKSGGVYRRMDREASGAGTSKAKPETRLKPPETPPTGPGMAAQPASPEARLSQSLQGVPKQKPPPQGPAAQPLGITPLPGLVTGLQKVAQSAQRVWHEIADVPKFAPFKRVINKFNGDTQRTSLKIRQMQADIESRVPDPKRLEAITNWLQADGDVARLRAWEAASRNATRRQGYRDAQHLTPYEVQVAKAIRQYYDDLLARGQAYGILDQAKDDYVTQIWKRPLLGGAQFAQFASKLSRTFKFGMKSVFENFFDGEQAGYKPVTKNISKLLGVYVSELEKTIATRDMIRDLTHETASDGNPLAKVEGTAHIGKDAAGDPTGPMFVRPGVVKGEVRYAQMDHPALKNWKWISKDPESGRDVFILGELRVHPEIRRHLANVLSQSQIRKWMREPSESELANIVKLAARFGDTTSKVVKQTMLGTLSTFHHVQEGTHGLGHRANAFLPPKLPVGTPELNYALDHGLQLAGEGAALENFREGLGSHGVFDKVPVLGKWIEKHNDLLFNEYIPRLKWDTWQRINRRNMERYQKEIASGEVTADDVAYLSSKQTNAAFGHQNYADLGRNATVQHGLRLLALAPDFFEARTRFAGQAFQGLLSKVGREQLEALSLLGGVFFIGARVLNKLSDDEWHFDEPFRVKYGNRWYGMRSVPEDIWRAFNDTRMFFYNRLSPVIGRPLVELASRVNYRGEKITPGEVFKNALVSGIPIQMREAPAFKSLTETQRNTTIGAWEQFLSSVGVQVSRYSPLNQTYKLATKWRKAQGEKEAPTTYPVSKYQPLRYALEDHDLTRAADELTKLTEGGKVPLTKIAQGFRISLHRPFSGSLANEGKFVAGLTPDQKALYKEAIAQRSRVWREFTNAEQEYHNRLKEGR